MALMLELACVLLPVRGDLAQADVTADVTTPGVHATTARAEMYYIFEFELKNVFLNSFQNINPVLLPRYYEIAAVAGCAGMNLL